MAIYSECGGFGGATSQALLCIALNMGLLCSFKEKPTVIALYRGRSPAVHTRAASSAIYIDDSGALVCTAVPRALRRTNEKGGPREPPPIEYTYLRHHAVPMVHELLSTMDRGL